MIDGWLDADWPAPPGVRAGTTTRRFPGVSQPPYDRANFGTRGGDDPAAVARNRALLHETLRLPSDPRWLHQVHGTTVACFDSASIALVGAASGGDALASRPPGNNSTPSVGAASGGDALDSRPPGSNSTPSVGAASGGDALDSRPHGNNSTPSVEAASAATATCARSVAAADCEGSEPQADAAVTRTPGIVLAILTADCLPVVFATDDGSVIAAAHAGWRGLAAGVLEATIDAMRADPARIIAWLGPAAGPAAYEVGEDVRSAFVDHDPPAAAAFTPTRPGHWHCNLYALARRRLTARNLTRVTGGTHCTITDRERYYSHRRDQRTGRMVTVVWRDDVDVTPD
ncbi:MAG: peptidoglycan editing factor PgeF [Xanthomonadaceae bacterium]|nr:peptidoglycan editing factor PgeF [Xanthomonadaceae bacterium]